MVEVVRHKKDRSEIVVPSMEVVQQYGKHMGGVHCSDQLISMYGVAKGGGICLVSGGHIHCQYLHYYEE